MPGGGWQAAKRFSNSGLFTSMAISTRTGTSTHNRSINAITRPNSQRCPRLDRHCDCFLEEKTDDKTGHDGRLEYWGLRRRSKRATPYGTEDILEILAGRIEKFDKGLNRLFHQEKTKERIGFEHKAVCVLFARNIVAKNQVQVANK